MECTAQQQEIGEVSTWHFDIVCCHYKVDSECGGGALEESFFAFYLLFFYILFQILDPCVTVLVEANI